jgi:hypothetical protein
MVDKPIVEWGGAIGSQIVADRLDRLKRTEYIQFLAEACVLSAAKRRSV